MRQAKYDPGPVVKRRGTPMRHPRSGRVPPKDLKRQTALWPAASGVPVYATHGRKLKT